MQSGQASRHRPYLNYVVFDYSGTILLISIDLDVNVNYVNTQTGKTSSIYLGALFDYEYLQALALINTYGIKGDFIDASYSSTLSYGDIDLGNYLFDSQGNTRYFFVDVNPDQSLVKSISTDTLTALLAAVEAS